ncbi:MAG: ATP-binding protein [Chloroflexia bacterium]|nr:ATP-binding protein [Chloroflexia bacterium]
MSELFFDKATTITLMRQAFGRLRAQRLYLADVLHALQQRGIGVSRARFDDMFMTRPDRDIGPSLDVFTAVVAVLFDYDAHIFTATELFELMVAVRVPINAVQSFAGYFEPTAWQEALQHYGFYTPKTTVQMSLIGRNSVIDELNHLVLARSNLAVTGPAGIGKTAVAFELMRRYESHHGQKTYYLDANGITSLAQLYEQLAFVFRVKPIANEPILLRLTMVLRNEQPYLFIDNVDDEDESHLRPETLIDQVMVHLPTVRCIITSRKVGVVAQFPHYQERMLAPLPSDHIKSSACQLFMRIFTQAGGKHVEPEYVLESCRAVQGNPLLIGMIANAVALGPQALPKHDFVERTLAVLSPIEMRILGLLSLCSIPVTTRFLTMLATSVFGVTAENLTQQLDSLVQRHVIYRITNDDDFYVVHAVIRQVLVRIVPEETYRTLLRDVVKFLGRTDISWEDARHDVTTFYKTNDVILTLHVVTQLLNRAMTVEAANILINWHTLWGRHGLSTAAISQVERCMVVLGDMHPLSAELSFVAGSLYSARGMFSLAMSYLQRTKRFTEQNAMPFLWGRVVIEIGMNALVDMDEFNTIPFAELCGYMDQAIHYFSQNQHMSWLARTHDMYAYMHFVKGNLRDALAHSDTALELFRTNGVTLGLLDASYNRGLILIAAGDFHDARQYLQFAQFEFTRLNIPMNIAGCALRIAAVNVLEGKYVETRRELQSAFDILQRAGGLQDILYIMDIYSGLLMWQGQARDTLGLSALIQQFRAERRIYRGPMLDHVFLQQLAIAQQMSGSGAPQSTRFEPGLTFYDVISIIRQDLLAE